MFHTFLILLSTAWVVSEIGLAVIRRSGPEASHKDAGTLKTLNIVIYASVAGAIFFSTSRHGHLAIPESVQWFGFTVILAGLALKWWAVFSLRRFFTVDVAVFLDHQLIKSGPYKILRHPAYAGVLLSFLGLAICTSNWLSAIVIVVPISAVFLYRVSLEERVLDDAFPHDYSEYSESTSRLIPGVY